MDDQNLIAGQKTNDDFEIDELLNQLKIEDGPDNRNLLPSDDQLDRFVESLCENASSSALENSANGELESKKSAVEYFPSLNTSTVDTERKVEINNAIKNNKNGMIRGSSGISLKMDANAAKNDNVHTKQSEAFENEKPGKVFPEKRSLPKNNLNVAIMQCNRSLENLVAERKTLESLIQKRHHIQNINYNVMYTPRLPEVPTRVDRLLYDANTERCRILGLMTTLESTINSFFSKNTKEQLRNLLLMYTEAIVNVLKERQSEINVTRMATTYDAGVVRLVKLIEHVHYMNRFVRTALWCLSFKVQTELAKARKRSQLATTTAGASIPTPAARRSMLTRSSLMRTEPPKCEIEKLMVQRWQILQTVHTKHPISPRPFRNSSQGGGKFRQNQASGNGMTQHQQQRSNISHLFSPPTSRQKKSRLMQLYAQEERAEIFERFSSARL